MIEEADETGPETETCRYCGRPSELVDGAHPLCAALRPLEQFLDKADDPTIVDDPQRYRDPVFVLYTMWSRLPRGELERIARFLGCELAPTNRMVADVALGGDKAEQALALTAMRAAGLEVVVGGVLPGDDEFPGAFLIVSGTSALRQPEFFHWLVDLLEPFDAHVETAGYAGSDADTRVTCAICKRNGPPELMKPFTDGFVHFLCYERERLAWRVGESKHDG